MSVEEFSACLQNQAYKKWFKASDKNILVQTASYLREEEQAAKKTSFMITEDTIADILSYLSGEEATIEQIKEVKDNMMSFMGKKKSFDISPNNDLYFPRVSFKTISSILEKGFKDIISIEGRKISDKFEKGHVYGIATNLLSQTMNNLGRSQVPEEAKKILLSALSSFEKELIKQDEVTTNLKNPEHRLYAKYKKTSKKYLVEMQLKSDNQIAGQNTKVITNQLRRYFDPENYVALEKNLRERDDKFMKTLINTKGSPSFVDILSKELVSILKGKSEKLEFNSPEVLVATNTVKIDKSAIQKAIKDDLDKVRKLKATIEKAQMRNLQGRFTSLASLQVILNQALSEQIAKNMGKGTSKNILNYRSGRFADSVTVQRLSQSKEGMITAFYSYMKYPYQTFEPGFAQGSPTTRNPKLLISKSIREIGATLVGNRMRAVSI
jgi:hypothetical protein